MKRLTPIIIAALLLTSCASPRPWTTEEKIALGSSIIATILDISTTHKAFDNGCWEANPAMGGKSASKGTVVVLGIGWQAFATVITHYWADEYRTTVLGGKAVLNGFSAARNTGKY